MTLAHADSVETRVVGEYLARVHILYISTHARQKQICQLYIEATIKQCLLCNVSDTNDYLR